jgi:hypothetical protein
MLQQFGSRLGDENVKLLLHRVFGNRVVSGFNPQYQVLAFQSLDDLLSGVKIMTASPGESASIAALSKSSFSGLDWTETTCSLQASASTVESSG